MKSSSQLVLLLNAIAAVSAQTREPATKLLQWASPEGLTGFLAFFFILFFAYTAYGLLGAVQVPNY